MTPLSSRPTHTTSAARARPRAILTQLRRRWRLTVSIAALLILLLAGLVALAYHQGFFVRGPAADTATAFLTDMQHRDYPAAYALLAPDLKAHETEQAFATATDAIRQTDGPLTSFAARELNHDGDITVIGFDVTRAIRGSFSLHLSLVQDKSGQWLISGIDDL